MGYYGSIGTIVFSLFLVFYTINAQNTEGDVRLQDGSSIFEGRIEIYHNSEWTTVCIDDFDLIEADVVCQEIFQENAIAVVAGSEFGSGSSDESLLGVACTESDTTLLSCSNSGYSNTCDHTKDAGVNCQFPGYHGCHSNTAITVLQGALYTGRTDLTITDCIESCRDAGYAYSGTINGEQCACGNTIEESPGDVSLVSESNCNVACSGDSSEICGGDGYTSIYESSIGQDGGTYTLPEGYIYSPNFPSEYLGETVTWMIIFENPTRTAVTIRMFSLAAEDELVFTSGTGAVSETHLGSESLTLPYVWQTDLTASFEIQLTSATTDARNGFVISYEAITGSCGGDFTGTSGYIASPDYPDDAPQSSSCMYTITAPDNYIIVITVEQRLLPSGTSLNIVDDGVSTSLTSTGAIDASTTNIIDINFISGTTSSASTFLISYTASQGPCEALPTVPFGTLDPSISGTLYPPQTVSFTCDAGYSSSDDSVSCMEDGSWTSAECIETPPTTMKTITEAVTTEAEEATTAVVTEEVTTAAESVTTVPSSTTVRDIPSTAMETEANEPSTMAVTTEEAMPPATTEDTPPRTSDLCRVSRDPIMESLENPENSNVLALNVGNPLDCDGYVTGIDIFSSDTSTVTISVLRFLETNMYQLIGRFDVVGESSAVVKLVLDEADWIHFESGDMIGTSSTASSPLTYSENLEDSVDYMIWDLSVDEDFHTGEVGDLIELMATNNKPKRTYSWAASIATNITCAMPDIDNAKITPASDMYHYGDTVVVQCDDDYIPSNSATLTCLIDGTFESFTCIEKDRKTFFIIIGVVCVAVLGFLVVIVIVMMACVREEPTVSQQAKRSGTYASTGSGRSDNSQRFLIPIEDDGVRGKGMAFTNPTPVVVDERPAPLSDPQYPPIDYPLDDEREAIQAIDEAVQGFEGDTLSFESGPIDNRSGGDSARHHVTFSDRR